MYDITVIGAGPSGLTAAIYARRAGKSVLVIEKETFGGQITHSPKVENYPGFIEMSGNEFADKLIEQALYQGAEIELDEVTALEKTSAGYKIICQRGEFEARSVVIATGSHHRRLGLDKEDKFTGEGISYCAVCDGAFYKDMDVAVVGGGNSALQEAVLLSKTSRNITVVQNLPFLTGENRLREDIARAGNIRVILSSVVTEIVGDDSFEGIRIKNTETGEESLLKVASAFVAIGQKPENEAFKDVVGLDEYGYVISGEDCVPVTKCEGIFVAGDCRTKKIRQVATAVADGAVAALAACSYLDNNR